MHPASDSDASRDDGSFVFPGPNTRALGTHFAAPSDEPRSGSFDSAELGFTLDDGLTWIEGFR
jgi:hypothetical protein